MNLFHRCGNCLEFKPRLDFRVKRCRPPRKTADLVAYCRPCDNKLRNERRRRNGWPPKKNAKIIHARRHKKLRAAALLAYGGKCACCSEWREPFLVIDHVDNDGHYHRRVIGRKIYQWLKRQNYPQHRFQVLCFNCNMGKAWGRTCPHRYEISKVQVGL